MNVHSIITRFLPKIPSIRVRKPLWHYPCIFFFATRILIRDTSSLLLFIPLLKPWSLKPFPNMSLLFPVFPNLCCLSFPPFSRPFPAKFPAVNPIISLCFLLLFHLFPVFFWSSKVRILNFFLILNPEKCNIFSFVDHRKFNLFWSSQTLGAANFWRNSEENSNEIFGVRMTKFEIYSCPFRGFFFPKYPGEAFGFWSFGTEFMGAHAFELFG